MPKPTTKDELITEMRTERETLDAALAALTPEQMIEPGVVGDWSVKDVIAHLTAWHELYLGWYAAGQRGENPPTPAEGYNWGQLPALNERIYEQHRDQPLEAVMMEFRASYDQMLAAIEGASQEELFTPGYYAWTRKNALAGYADGCGGDHYHWASTEIRKGLKAKAKRR
jgi:uncharacterized protein (TIGR03083 family)